ncbi:ROK family transcriptional regulator [Pseudonocardia lutea]|uniref:ROK family transcriptional regulator n=1 Tax=Pseudonocardia lutea TaxID=2172015 RepID=A0ABW1I269_9PSEU
MDGATVLSEGARVLLHDLRGTPPLTRAQVGDRTGWSRGTVNARLDELIGAGLLRECGLVEGARGRPAVLFSINPDAGDLLVGHIGASGAQLARCDLTGGILARESVALDVGAGPEVVLGLLEERFAVLRADVERPLWGVAVGLPGPVHFPTGRVVSPPIMTGWDGFDVPGRLGATFEVPVHVENDANAMAWGERCLAPEPGPDDLLFVKVGTGVGAGIVANGRILRGAQGAAGDLGHTFVDAGEDGPPPLCRCGKSACLEAYAGGWAIARDLGDLGDGRPRTALDVVALLRAGDARAIQRVRAAGRVLGVGLAQAVSLLNPSEIVVGGPLAAAGGEHLLAGIRQHVAARSLPLATQDLRIRVTRHGDDVGPVGLADALAARLFEPDTLARVLSRGTGGLVPAAPVGG